LRRGSQITTDAGKSEGGNININSNLLLALPRENSDITANARSASGGGVNLNVANVFGLRAVGREEVRSRLGLTDAEFTQLQVNPTSLLPTSDIAAISQNSGPAFQGTVTFSSSGVNPAQGLVELPQNVVNPAQLIATNPCIEGAENEFTVTGRGGVPPSPKDSLSEDSVPFAWVENFEGRREDEGRRKKEEGRREDEGRRRQEVVAAQGWVMNASGEVMLVGYNSGNYVSGRIPQRGFVCVPR
jgi:large exoprotein involved in heme utilization and adhesion